MLLFAGRGTGAHGSIAEAVDFDGANDYLSRASDFTGNADGKTFTFSAWVWPNTVAAFQMIYRNEAGYFYVALNASNQLDILGLNAAGVTILRATVSTIPAIQTFANILISLDLANTANRAIYINDVAQSVTWTTYTNDSIDFTRTSHGVGATNAGATPIKGRLAHVFLDYTYRDLSIEANRRLFITADRKPTPKATLAALSPILYPPMDDPTTAHVNLGTGGDMVLNGVIARSGRGPNQYNTPYSDLDGAADYLSRTTAPTGIADGKQFTFHCVFNTDEVATARPIVSFCSSTNIRFEVRHDNTKSVRVVAYNASAVNILDMQSPANSTTQYRNCVVEISVDLADTAKRYIIINGVNQTLTVYTFTNDTVDFAIATTPYYRVCQSPNSGAYWNGRLGDVFFHTSYIDLSVASNLAKFVTGTGIDAKPADLGANGELPLGTSPLIYLPMYGNNAGKNYGTGGDFTVNSGPYPGARGPNEFWGNKADFDGTTGYLARTSALSGVSDGKVVSGAFFFNSDAVTSGDTFFGQSRTVGTAGGFKIAMVTGVKLQFLGYDTSGTKVLDITCSTVLANSTDYTVRFCFDLSDTGKRYVYLNGVAETLTVTTYTNANMALGSAERATIGAYWSGSYGAFHDGRLAEMYLVNSYIDFSQEANRLLFHDAFGNPTDLPAAIAKGTVPNPAIYMRFDPANQGKNSGTGGDFTKTGTIIDGGQL